jgi:chromosome segregation ATPase
MARQFRIRGVPGALANLSTITNRTPSASSSSRPDFTPTGSPDDAQLLQLLTAQRDEHKREIIKLETELREKLKRNKRQKLEFEKEIALENARLAKQQERIETLAKHNPDETTDYKAANAELKSRIDSLDREKGESEKRLEALTLELRSAQQKLKEVKEEVKSLPQAPIIENMLHEKRKMEQQRDSEIGGLRSQIDDGNIQIEKLSAQLDQSTKRSEVLQEENVRLVAELDTIEGAVRSVRTDCAKLREHIDQNGPVIPYEQVRARIGQMEERRRELLQKRETELQGKLDSAVGHKDYLKEELRRRLEIIEQLNKKVNDLTHQATEAKSQADKEIQQLKKNHQLEVKKLRERLKDELEAALAQQRRRILSAVPDARHLGVK